MHSHPMKNTQQAKFDVTIIGAGAVGSALAIRLSEKGLKVALVDKNEQYPEVFKAERIGVAGVDRMKDLDVFKYAEPFMVRTPQVTNYRHSSKVLFQERSGDYAFHHHEYVRSLQNRALKTATFFQGTFDNVQAESWGKRVILKEGGDSINSRAVVIATGVGRDTQKKLNLEVESLGKNYSFIYGGNLYLDQKPKLDFPMNVFRNYHADKAVAYMLVFQLPECIRYNLFTYWDSKDPRRKRMNQGSDGICSMMEESIPYLKEVLGDFHTDEKTKGAAISLTRIHGSEKAEVFLAGDACGRTCPAYGYGLIKGMNDAYLLGEKLPEFLATPDAVPGYDQVADYTCDPVKIGYDEQGEFGSFDCRGRVLAKNHSSHIRKARTLATPGWAYPVVGYLRSLKPPAIPL